MHRARGLLMRLTGMPTDPHEIMQHASLKASINDVCIMILWGDGRGTHMSHEGARLISHEVCISAPMTVA